MKNIIRNDSPYIDINLSEESIKIIDNIDFDKYFNEELKRDRNFMATWLIELEKIGFFVKNETTR